MVSKRFLKTVLSMIFVFVFATVNLCNVSAAKKDVMFDLTSLNILEGVDVSEEPSVVNITRAEFSKLVVNLLGYSDIADDFDDLGVFADISDSKYKGAINLLYDMKVISGTGLNTFSPDSPLTYPQVGKFMVNILGYSNIVGSTQLHAFSMLAGSLGVYDDVDSSGEYVTWQDALIIIHNALDIDIMTKDFGMIGDNYHVVEGKTLRTSLATTSGQNLKKFRGIVTADSVTYLYQSHKNMKADQVEINGKVYKCGFEVPYGLVGMEVNFYVDYTNNPEGVVTSIGASSKNTVTKVSLDKLSSVSSNEVKYFVNDEKIERLEVNSAAKVIYNDRWNKNASVKDLGKYKNGFATFIDNDEDGVADIVFVYEFKDAIVERAYAETKQIYFANNQIIDGTRYISLDDEKNDIIVKIMGINGEELSFESIVNSLNEGVKPIISIAKSLDKQVITIVAGGTVSIGVISEVDDYTVTIGSRVYDYITAPSYAPGTHVNAYRNFMDKVFYMEKTAAENTYAYVLKVQQSNGIDGTVKVGLLMPGYISETSTESFDEAGTADSTKELFFRNNSKNIYELADKVKINGTPVTAANAIPLISEKVISYGFDAKDKINKIDVLVPFNNDVAKKSYNQNGKTFSSKATEGFGITESATMSICVPANAGASDDDLLVPVKLVHGSEYSINGYDVDETSSIAGLVVINAVMQSGIAGSISPVTSNVAVLKKVSRVLNAETGDEVLKVNMLTKEGEKSYVVSPLMSQAVYNRFVGMNKGDVFFYETIEGTDELRNCQVLQSIKNYDGIGTFNVGQVNEICIGTVTDCRYNYVSAVKNRWTNSVTVDGATTYEIYKTGTPPIFIIDDDGNATSGTFDDIQCGNKIYVGSVYSTVRAVVIRK